LGNEKAYPQGDPGTGPSASDEAHRLEHHKRQDNDRKADGQWAEVPDGKADPLFPPNQSYGKRHPDGRRHGDGRTLVVKAFGEDGVGEGREEGEAENEVRQERLHQVAQDKSVERVFEAHEGLMALGIYKDCGCYGTAGAHKPQPL
jgi:hypothetical protein